MNGGYRNKCVCIYSYGAFFMVKNSYKFWKIGIQEMVDIFFYLGF